jgi:hypothetical protein
MTPLAQKIAPDGINLHGPCTQPPPPPYFKSNLPMRNVHQTLSEGSTV